MEVECTYGGGVCVLREVDVRRRARVVERVRGLKGGVQGGLISVDLGGNPATEELLKNMLALFVAASAAPSEILLADFKGTQGATFKWKANNDPVRGSAPRPPRGLLKPCLGLSLPSESRRGGRGGAYMHA